MNSGQMLLLPEPLLWMVLPNLRPISSPGDEQEEALGKQRRRLCWGSAAQ